MQKPGITSPLVGVRTLEQLEDNLGALEFTLTKEQMARLDHVSNPASWPFPHSFFKGLDTFMGLGLDMEMPKKYRALQQLETISLIEICAFSGAKIYPGKGKIYVRVDNRSFRFVNGKAESLFLQRKNPRKISWTVLFRRMHKKGISEE
ncbi:60S ribosomal protein L24, partial [Podila epigama]